MAEDTVAAARGSLSLLALQTVVRIVAFGAVVAATRVLVPDEFGRYSTVAAVVLLATFLADFGTSPAITRLSSRSPGEADALLSGTLLASLAMGIFVYIGVVAMAWVCYPTGLTSDVALGAMAIPGASMASSILGAMDGEGLIARRALLTATQGVVVAAGMVPVLAGASVRAPIIALAAAPWVGLVLAWATARRSGFWKSPLRFDVARTKALLRSALPFGLSGGLTVLTMRFDVLLLSALRPSAETASYDLALRVLEASAYLSSAICTPLLFILSRRMGERDRSGAERAYIEAMRIMYLLGIPLSVVLAMLAHPIVDAAFGASFRSVATPLAVMGGAQCLAYVILVQGALVLAGDAVGRGVAVGAVIALITVVLNVLLVPGLGALGASIAAVIAWVAAVWALHRFHRRVHNIRTPLPPPGILLAAAAMAASILALRQAPLLFTLATAAATYVIALLLTRTVSEEDLRRLRAVVASRGG